MIRLSLSDDERSELELIRDRHATPYLRERAAAILRVADGISVRQVAQKGLYRCREPETVADWIRAYATSRSVPKHKGRRGRFSPRDSRFQSLIQMLRLSPQLFGFERSTWTVSMIGKLACPELRSYSGIYKRLRCLKIAKKQARLHITSPDPLYHQKMEAIEAALAGARAQPDRERLLYADQITFYRQPSLTRCLRLRGERPTPQWTGSYNNKHRVCASLDACTGEIAASHRSAFDIKGLTTWLALVRKHYGPTMKLVVVWDNWPIHSCPAVVAAAKEQNIKLLYLPTYAPWTNPIEKFWRLLRQTLTHMHRFAKKERWHDLIQQVARFTAKYSKPSPDLLHYVGLAPKCTV